MNPEKTAEIIELIVDTIAVAAFFICVEIIRRILFSKKPVEVTLPDPVVIPESIKEVEAAVSNELIESSKRVYLYKAFCAWVNQGQGLFTTQALYEYRITSLVISAIVVPVVAITAGTFLYLIVSSPPRQWRSWKVPLFFRALDLFDVQIPAMSKLLYKLFSSPGTRSKAKYEMLLGRVATRVWTIQDRSRIFLGWIMVRVGYVFKGFRTSWPSFYKWCRP